MRSLKEIEIEVAEPFLLVFIFLFAFDMAYADQDVVYKESKPLKQDVDDGDYEELKKNKGLNKGFLYDPTGKTDPFQSFIAVREEAEKKKTKPRTYLETLELSQLDLIVIVVSKKGKWAMVRDSKGLGHVVKEGTAIGTNSGIVYKINEGEVTIREEYKDFRGQIQQKDIVKKTPLSQIDGINAFGMVLFTSP